MKSYFLILLIVCFFSIKCSHAQKNDNSSAWVSNNIDSLRLWLDIPFEIKSIKWQVASRGNNQGIIQGPEDYSLFADMKFGEQQMKKIDSLLNKVSGKREVFVDTNFLKEWFPHQMKSLFIRDGNYLKSRREAYNYNSLINSKYGLNEGWIIRLDENTVFLALYSK